MGGHFAYAIRSPPFGQSSFASKLSCYNFNGAKRNPTSPKLMPLVLKRFFTLHCPVFANRFILNTRRNPTTHEVLTYSDEFSVRNSHFRGHKNTKIIVHGFIDYGTRKWLMVNPFLPHHPFECKCDMDSRKCKWSKTQRFDFMLTTLFFFL